MGKMIRSFRSKMIVLFGLSMVLASGVTYVFYKVLQLYYYTTKVENPLTQIRYFMRKVGDVNFFLIVFIPLSILFFYLLTKKYSIYFQKISFGINRLACGDFNGYVHIPSKDEFGLIARDINLASEQLQQALERGDFAESSKEELVLNLAHDLRTPLTSVVGYLDFIIRDEELSAEQVKHYATIAFAKSQRLEKLIDELFEITKMNYGKQEMMKQPINLSELLVQLIEEMYPVFEKNHLIAQLDVASHLLIHGEGDLLARVFENILSNACRYGNDGQFIKVNGYREGEDAVIDIVNYGDPIPEEMMAYIFDMFYTGDKARTQQSGSTGLGLFIAHNIVKQHQGSITVRSDSVCTIFTVRLPLLHSHDSRS